MVGRRNMAAETALSCATAMLPVCVLSMRSKATSWPALSTMATAIGRLCRRASAKAAASTLRAWSNVTLGPYCGT